MSFRRLVTWFVTLMMSRSQKTWRVVFLYLFVKHVTNPCCFKCHICMCDTATYIMFVFFLGGSPFSVFMYFSVAILSPASSSICQDTLKPYRLRIMEPSQSSGGTELPAMDLGRPAVTTCATTSLAGSGVCNTSETPDFSERWAALGTIDRSTPHEAPTSVGKSDRDHEFDTLFDHPSTGLTETEPRTRIRLQDWCDQQPENAYASLLQNCAATPKKLRLSDYLVNPKDEAPRLDERPPATDNDRNLQKQILISKINAFDEQLDAMKWVVAGLRDAAEHWL